MNTPYLVGAITMQLGQNCIRLYSNGTSNLNIIFGSGGIKMKIGLMFIVCTKIKQILTIFHTIKRLAK